jgi:hypothetical protein
MTVAVATETHDAGVTVVEVNLKFVWDLISRIGIGKTGYAYVVDHRGQLLSHPDISKVLQKSDFSCLPQVRDALTAGDITRPNAGPPDQSTGRDPLGNPVLASYAPIAGLDWMVLVEQPLTEAYAPLYSAVGRTGLLLLIAFPLAVLASLGLARHIAMPVRALQQGAVRIGAGALEHRMEVKTGDE